MIFFHYSIGGKHKLGDLRIPWSLVYELLSAIRLLTRLTLAELFRSLEEDLAHYLFSEAEAKGSTC